MIWSDMRLGLRLLAKRPGQTAVAIFILSLGIGLTTAMFSILYGTFLRGLPFEDPERFVIVDRSNPAADLPRAPVPYQDFLEWRSQQRSFEDLVAWLGISVGIVGDGVPPGHFNGAVVTTNIFDVIGVSPLLGRGFLPEDALPGAPPVAVISEKVWKEMFAGDPGILGRSIQVNGEPRTVSGVMPARFEFPLRQDLWMPLRGDDSEVIQAPLQVFGKLKEGMSLRHAQAEMSTIAERLAGERPETNAGFGALLSRYTHGYTDEGLRRSQELLLAAVLAVLAIACVNAASLLLVQSTQRLNELAVRTALGARRRRLVAQLLTEAAILVVAGGMAGLLVARWAIDAYLRLFGEMVSNFWMDIRLDPMAFAAAAAVSGLAVLLTGLPAALLGSEARPAEVLKEGGARVGGGGFGRVYRGLCVVEIALSFALLVVTGLMIKSILNLGRVELGAEPAKVLVASISLDGARYSERTAQLDFFRDLIDRVGALPGARVAGLASRVPGDRPIVTPFEVEGRVSSKDAAPETREVVVSQGCFEVFGLKPLEGRVFTDFDGEGAPAVAVVNRSFARRHFPGESPVGRRVRLVSRRAERPWTTIVGVVPDMALGGVEGKEHDGIYQPLAQRGGRWMDIVVRTEASPLSLALPIRKAVAALDPTLSVFWVQSLESYVAFQTLSYRSAAYLFTLFGSLALLLAVVGLYEVMTLTLRLRRREIGIRVALGAAPNQIRFLVLRYGVLQVAAGVLLGVAFAAVGLRLVAGFLFDVEVWDVPVLIAASCIVAIAGLLACLPASLQASRLSPVSVLKTD